MSKPKSSDYQVRFAGALVAGFFMAAIAFWALESGFRLAAVSAAITFALVWLYAVITWGFLWKARSESRRNRRRDGA